MKIQHNIQTVENINDEQLNFLFQLLRTNSPSGFEKQIVNVLQSYMSSCCDTYTDRIGNFYIQLKKNNDANRLRVMLTAHADEVGLQVTYIDKYGFVYARNVASIDKQTLPGNKVIAITNKKEIVGVIGKRPPHILAPKDKDIAPNICDLWIDFGFESLEEAKRHIEIGDYITLQSDPYISYNGKRLISKALDNKIGVFVLSEVMRKLSQFELPISVVGVATAQEEIGCRGAFIAANRIKPDIAFCMDVGIGTDIPNVSNQQYGILELGKGVGIIRNADNNDVLVSTLKETANKFGIPYQQTIGHRPTGGTESSLIQLANMGIATANISIPNRYMHSLVEMCDLRDVSGTINLLMAEIEALCALSKEDFNLFNKNK